MRHIVKRWGVSLREILALFRREKILWAVVEPAGPDCGWNIRAVHDDSRTAWIIAQGLMDAGRTVTVRRYDLVQREIAARVYQQDI